MMSFSMTLPPHKLQQKAREWLEEDIPSFDFAGAVVGNIKEQAVILCKSDGVLCGVPFVNAVFKEVGCEIEWNYEEGELLVAPVHAATVSGNVRNILMGERLALNILSRASGIASQAREAREIAQSEGWNGHVAGTRKTTPGFRLVEKYSLLVGGVSQHRNDLSSMVMLKDNHLWTTGGDVTKAVEVARKACGFSQKIEVECRSYQDAHNAATAGAEIVMLDNFEPETAKKTAEKLKKEFPHLLIEVSGGITPKSLSRYFSEHVDILSMSCLIQGYSCIDYSMKIKKENRDPTNPIVSSSNLSSDGANVL